MSYKTHLMEAFEKIPFRPGAVARRVEIWQRYDELGFWRASVEGHGGSGASPEDAVAMATKSYLDALNDAAIANYKPIKRKVRR